MSAGGNDLVAGLLLEGQIEAVVPVADPGAQAGLGAGDAKDEGSAGGDTPGTSSGEGLTTSSPKLPAIVPSEAPAPGFNIVATESTPTPKMVATATPGLATPRPTPAPTENPDQRITVGTAATEAPPFLRSQIGSEVSAQDREIAAATTECVFEYLDSLGLPEISDHITLHMYEDFETVVETYSIQAGQSNSFSRDFWKERFADSWPDWAFINLSNAAVDGSIQDVPLLAFHIANTFTRFILYHLSELLPGASEGQVPQMGPYWLYLGINYYLRGQAISTACLVQYEEIRETSHVVQANLVERPLRGMETREGFVGEDRTGHRVGLLAAELLSSYSGQSSLVRYFAFLQPGTPWQEAFEAAFGVTVEEFYDRFEAHRAAGFPVVDAPIDAPFHVELTTLLGENDPPTLGSVVFSDDFFEPVTDLTGGAF